MHWWEVEVNLEANILRYLDGATPEGGRKPDARYTSFDYCFNYFQSFFEADRQSELAAPQNLQSSCLQIGFYLASWGMFRGSGDLYKRSVHHYVPLIEAIATAPTELWMTDAHNYDASAIRMVLSEATRLAASIGGMSPILVTKVMLGVFGCVPAFDTNFKAGFGATTFGPKSLRRIGDYYESNAAIIERYRVPTLDFATGAETDRRYTRSKVIDMAFFVEGAPSGSV